MSIKTRRTLVIVVAWLIVAGLIIIPRFISIPNIATNATIPTIATNATNADIVNAIYSLQTNLQNTINTAMGVGVGILITVIGVGIGVMVAVMLVLK